MKLPEGAAVAGAAIVRESDTVAFVTSEWGLGKISVSEFPLQKRAGQGVLISKLAENEKISGMITMPSGKSTVMLHYGKQKTRAVRPAMIKTIKRAKTLEYFIKLVNQTVTGLTLTRLEGEITEKAPDEKKETAKERTAPETDAPLRETPASESEANGDDQISLF